MFHRNRILACLLAVLTAPVTAQQTAVAVEHVHRMPNTGNPELMYVFMQEEQLKDEAYMKDVDLAAGDGTFDFLFLTQRGRVDFYDYDKMRPIFQRLVARAHARGIKVGLQLWPQLKGIPDDALQGIVVEDELNLDARGHAEFTAHSRGVRMTGTTGGASSSEAGPIYAAVRSGLLRLYAFKKTAEGQYAPGSVTDLTSQAKVTATSKDAVTVTVDAPELAGETIYAMTVHYHQYPDLFASFLPDTFARAVRAYADVHFDGTALDEFRYMTLDNRPGVQFRERLYTPKMAEFFKAKTGHEMERVLFDMRYAPSGNPMPRVRAIDEYFDVLRQGPLAVEQAFAKETTEVLGPRAFHGIHDTFHNALDNDEIWQTGINWWAVPRDYGQTDENTPMTTRLGIGMAHPRPVEYNQYYTADMHRFLEEGIMDARFNVRVHYHALNDTHGWGKDLRDPDLRKGIAAVEDKVRLLNQFDPPRPLTNVLFVFGYPALANWFQPSGERNRWDINGALHAEEKAVEAWQAGYRCVFAPSYLIDDGTLRVDAGGGVEFGGQRFEAMVFIGPEYSKQSTLRFLEDFAARGGRLIVDGAATRDFDGNDVSGRWNGLASTAVATSFSLEAMAKLGVPMLAVDEGAVYEDGSVVLADLDSLLTRTPKAFSIEVAGHRFTGAYIGLLAIKAGPRGELSKLAAGGLSELDRDGVPLVRLSEPADVVKKRQPDGEYRGLVTGQAIVGIER